MINDGVQILVRATPTSIEILICQPTAMAGKRKNAVISFSPMSILVFSRKIYTYGIMSMHFTFHSLDEFSRNFVSTACH
jgi:hypothetical protein